jgi:hypothetical protein
MPQAGWRPGRLPRRSTRAPKGLGGKASCMRWDDIEILRAIDALQEQHGGPAPGTGREVMNEA